MSGDAAFGPPEVVCLGETMSMLTAGSREPLRSRPGLAMHVGGAESNVACGLAHLGHDVEWLGRVGADPFGQGVVDFLGSRAVRTTRVVYDDRRPTGIYFKDTAERKTAVYYYRSGSAASVMARSDVGPGTLDGVRMLHVSGITAALSASCDDLLEALVVERRHGAGTVTFDVNFRPGLWSATDAAPRLHDLAQAADLVVVGRDEAETLWGTTTPEDVRALFADVPRLVVKDDHVGATYFGAEGTVFQPSLGIRVVEPVGAGDAFAAGLLSGWLRGMPPDRCLRHGHLLAALTLRHVSDLPALPPAESIQAWSLLQGSDWQDLDVDAVDRTEPTWEGRP